MSYNLIPYYLYPLFSRPSVFHVFGLMIFTLHPTLQDLLLTHTCPSTSYFTVYLCSLLSSLPNTSFPRPRPTNVTLYPELQAPSPYTTIHVSNHLKFLPFPYIPRRQVPLHYDPRPLPSQVALNQAAMGVISGKDSNSVICIHH